VEKTDGSTGKTALAFEDAKRPMTVQDLLRHTSGLVYGPFGNSLVHRRMTRRIYLMAGRRSRSL